MDCFINVGTLHSLRKLVGNDDALFSACYSEAVGTNKQPTKEFSKWYEETHDGKKLDVNDFAKEALEYHYFLHPDGNVTARKKETDTSVITFGYTDVVARNFAKRFVSNQMLVAASSDETRAIKDPAKRKEFVINKAKNNVKANLIDRIAAIKGLSREEAFLEFKKGIRNLDDIFNSDEVFTQDKNLYALFNEVIARSRVDGKPNVTLAKALFEDALRDNRLAMFKFPKENNDELNAEEAADEDSANDADKEDKENDDYRDEFIANTEHSGTYSTFQKHIGDKLNIYLSTIPKLTSTEGDIHTRKNDTSNPLGVQDFHSANEIFSVLYGGYIDYTNITTMAESIKALAQKHKELSGLITLYEDIYKDFSLACELYSTFSKTVISKQEVLFDGDKATLFNNNRNIDKDTALRFEFLNGLRHSIINAEEYALKSALHSVSFDVNNNYKVVNGKNVVRDTAKEYETIDKVAAIIHSFIPTLSKDSISNYVRLNKGEGNEKANLQELISIANSLVSETESVKANYIARENNIREAYSINKALDDSKKAGNPNKKEIWDKYSHGHYPTADDYRDVSAAREQEYLTPRAITLSNELANKLSPYSTINVELNSYNVHGNQSSNVINSSWLTGFIRIVQSKEALENFGKLMFQSNQYDYSNILVEKTDANGKVINKGLFRLVDGKYQPTEYAHRLAKVKLFDGAANESSDTAATYSNMSKADYIATAVHQFFEAENEEAVLGKDTEVADYFLRTPSDASRNFVVTLPRYSTKSLFRLKNPIEANKKIDAKINEIAEIPADEEGIYDTLTPVIADKKRALDDLTKGNLRNRTIKASNINTEVEETLGRKPQKGDTITVTYHYTNNDGVTTKYVLEGTYGDKNNNGIVLEKPTLKGVLSHDMYGAKEIGDDLLSSIHEQLRQTMVNSGELEMIIDKSSPVYQQYKAVFMQELTNAKTAFDKIFEEDGEGGYKAKLNPNQTFANYHQKGGKFYVEADGRRYLVGNVFRSAKFQLNGRNYLGELFAHADNSGSFVEPVFDFFYGGATKAITTNPTTGAVVLNEAQEEAVDAAISEYIKDFVFDSTNRLNEFENVLKKENLSPERISDFAINYNLMYMNFDDIFEGDMKFYKDTQTALKRAKESQGSGVPYGIFNAVRDNSKVTKDEIVTSPLSKPFTKVNADGTKEDYFVRQYDGFRGVTIKNTIRTQEEVLPNGVVAKALAKAYRKEGLSEKDAIAKANAFLKGYEDTTVNDAQSYITFNEWVRRVTARGQFDKYKPLIEKILDESQELNPKDIKEFIQVQKNFYYDLHYNAELGVVAPRQIKNAEFVLVPRLIKDTQLEQVAKLMDKFGIDQLNTEETSKAGKANILTLWDNNGEIDSKIIEDLDRESGFKSDFCKAVKSPEACQIFDYNHLYTQQETPQHINAENKAAIQIMKKIVDNIDKDSSLYAYKETFMDCHAANVYDDFVELMQDCGLELDEDGNLKLDEQGNPVGLDAEVFFEKLQAEAERQAFDSNMMDFLTLQDEERIGNTPLTRMPLFMSNVSTKLENIAQAMFNNSITRQKLPGFHAAQITNIGFKAIRESVKSYAYSHSLRYHSDKNGNYTDYIEVMLPAANFGFKRTNDDGSLKSDDELLDELKAEGLDEILGYRIPTEGKQSVCKFKVVGFTDDALGSTIVVPDAWVSQTGSDFDIDSVYGIQYNTKLDKNGKIRKVKYSDNPLENYIKYVTHNVHHRIENKAYAYKDIKIKEAKARLDDAYKKAKEALNTKESEIYHSLTDATREALKTYDAAYKEEYGEAKNKAEYRTQLLSRVRFINEDLIPNLDNKEVISSLKDFADVSLEIVDSIDNAGSNLFEEKGNAIKEVMDSLKDEYLKVYEETAKDAGLMSFEEFSKLSTIKQNGKRARQNKMLDSMKAILSHEDSLEENLSRSNFDDLIKARNAIYAGTPAQIARQNRTSYNFIDQAEYQDDAMSGAKLKAFSVTRDTFCSVCNTVRPTIHQSAQFKVVLPLAKYDVKTVKDSFGDKAVVDKENGTITLTVDKLGWSKNNKNIAGKIITAYSSQTTAHILDAIKDGAIPNENDYTFAVFKTFPDVGLDFETAVAFIMQPGVTRIVNAYNVNKSIYVSGNYNPIHAAIKDIAKALDIKVDKFTPIDKVIEELNKNGDVQKSLAKLFGIKDNISLDHSFLSDIPLDTKLLGDRIKEKGVFGTSPVKESNNVDSLVFDLVTILQFNKLNALAQNIGDLARVSNPDKFGAKQSIFATNKVFDDIHTLIDRHNRTDNGILLNVDGVNFIESVYPGLSGSIDDYMSYKGDVKSSYPTLDAFLRYATAPSIKVNRLLFATQSDRFRSTIMHLVENFTGSKVMTEQTYIDYQNYVLGSMYSNVSAIKFPMSYSEEFGLQPAVTDNPMVDDAYEETQRIFGYNRDSQSLVEDADGNKVPFDVKDANHPTIEEVRQFLTLSPAQKVLWVQSRFSDGLVTKYLRVSTHNTFKGRIGKHTISFIENSDNIETIYNSFEKLLDNDNPLLSATAIDIIKYAFVVDGFKMRRRGVSKVIKNSTLFNDRTDNGSILDGIGFTQEVNDKFRGIDRTFEAGAIANLEERFLRSNPTLRAISTKRIDKVDKKSELGYSYYGMKRIAVSQKELLEKYNIATFDKDGKPIVNKYVRLKENYKADPVLYKIYDVNNGKDIFLIPLNKLEANEQSDISANAENNKFPNKRFYWEAIKDFTGKADVLWSHEWSEHFENRLKATKQTTPTDYITGNKKSTAVENVPFDLNNPKPNEVGAFDSIKRQINDWFGVHNGADGKILWISNLALERYIKSNSTTNGVKQIIITERSLDGKSSVSLPMGYTIAKAPFKEYARYLKYDNANDKVDGITNISKRTAIKKLQDFVRDNGKDITNYPLYIVTEDIQEKPDEVRQSALDEEAAQQGVQSFNFVAKAGFESGVKARAMYKELTGTLNPNAAKDNIGGTVRITAEFVDSTVKDILHNFDYFTTNTKTGKYLSIDDLQVIDVIANDIDERDKFLKTLLTAKALIRKFAEYTNLDVNAEDENLKYYLETIQDRIKELSSNNKLDRALKNFGSEYLKKLSNNPYIIQDILTVFDGYHSSNTFEAWFNDLQESTNPIVQIVTKHVMENIRSAEMVAKERVREFNKFKREVEKEAREKGLTIDMSKVVDENTRLRQDYNDDLRKTFVELLNNMQNLKAQGAEKHVEYLLAKHKLDAFKAEHFEQELRQDYYTEKLRIEEALLQDGIGKAKVYEDPDDPFRGAVDPFAATQPKETDPNFIGHRYIFSHYKQLKERQFEIRGHIDSQGNLADHWEKELKQVEDEIHKLLYGDNRLATDPLMDMEERVPNKETDLEGYKRYLLYGGAHRAALRNYVKAMQELNAKYYKYDSKFGFDEELKRNLDTIKAYEERNAAGELTVPLSELMKKDEYVKAKEWFVHNARYVYGESFWEEVGDALKKVSKGTSNNGRNKTRDYIRSLAIKHNILDNKGVVDGSKLTPDQIAHIKALQTAYYDYSQNTGLSQRKLIHNGNAGDEVYTADFYKGMTSDGVVTKEYNDIVWKINNILQKVYNSHTKTIRTDTLSIDDLNKLEKLYSELRDTTKKKGATNRKEVFKFIKDNVDSTIDQERFDTMNEWAKAKAEVLGEEWYKAWYDANTEIALDEDGEIITNDDGTVKIQPNSYLYGSIKPKDSVKEKFTDKNKTEALKALKQLIVSDKTEHYYRTYQEKQAEGKEAFQEWYDANHIYDPYKQAVVPLECWTESKPNPNIPRFDGQWVPSFKNTERTPKDGRDSNGDLDGSPDMRNPNYKGGDLYKNYRKGSGFDSDVHLNEVEKKIRDKFGDTLEALAQTESSRRFIRDGSMPVMMKQQPTSGKRLLKEGAKFLGYVSSDTGEGEFYNDSDITFANDRTMDMPMLQRLRAKDGVTFDEVEPNIEDYGGDIDKYNVDIDAYNKRKAEYEEARQKEHNDLVERNWWEVMNNFITKAGHFNAVQDQKLMLYYGEEMLKDYKVYQQKFGSGHLSKTLDTADGYEKVTDNNIHAQYVNWVRRLIYDQYKDKNKKFTKAAAFAQNITSNIYMMGNIKGGIANITMGETQILGEQFAKQYFTPKDWAMGKKYWVANALSFMKDVYSDKSTSTADALVKYLAVVDYDELNGTVKVAKGEEAVQRLRDAMFTPQAIGEHFMQNGAMFSMAYSHRLFENPKYGLIAGEPKYITKTLDNHIKDLADAELIKLLDDKHRKEFEELREKELSDPDTKKEIVRYSKNLTSEFAIRYLSKEERATWRKNYEEAKKRAKEEFNNDEEHPTLMSQFDLAEDGYLGFKDDSLMSEISVDERAKILGRFKGRVISVNKKIHGMYGKLDQAQIEKTWYGSLIMQYHKHIPSGFMKRFRRHGYFNEERETIEKGTYISLIDFLSLNLRAVKNKNGMSDAQTSALESIQNVFKLSFDFLLEAKSTYNILPEYEKANIRRSLGELCGFLSAICMAVAARAILDDDDESFVGNLALYEADRLASESMQFTPYGVYAQGKQLWSQPVAATGAMSDAIASLGQVAKMLMEGDDFDPNYHSGRFSGQNKLTVYIKRRIPLYRQYDNMVHISDDNHYYKITGNGMGFAKDIYDSIKR